MPIKIPDELVKSVFNQNKVTQLFLIAHSLLEKILSIMHSAHVCPLVFSCCGVAAAAKSKHLGN